MPAHAPFRNVAGFVLGGTFEKRRIHCRAAPIASSHPARLSLALCRPRPGLEVGFATYLSHPENSGACAVLDFGCPGCPFLLDSGVPARFVMTLKDYTGVMLDGALYCVPFHLWNDVRSRLRLPFTRRLYRWRSDYCVPLFQLYETVRFAYCIHA